MVAKHYLLNYHSNHVCTTKEKRLVKNAIQTYGIETYSAEFRLWHRHCCCQSVDYGIENYNAKASITSSSSQSEQLEIGIEICSVNLSESCSEIFNAKVLILVS